MNDTIEVSTPFRVKRMTKEQFINHWVDHVKELSYLRIDITEQTRAAAAEKFDLLAKLQRVSTINTLAKRYHNNPDMGDMILDELTTDPTRPDDEIASKVAMAHAFP